MADDLVPVKELEEVKDSRVAGSNKTASIVVYKDHGKVAIETATRFFKKRKWYDWATAFFFIGTLAFALKTTQKKETQEVIENPLAVPEYTDRARQDSVLYQINQEEKNLSAFLNEARQRRIISLAQGYRALAASFIQDPRNRSCYAKSAQQCLESMWQNRLDELQDLIKRQEQESFDKVSVFSSINPIMRVGLIEDKIEALRLAQILQKPTQSWQPWEKWEVRTRFPLLTKDIAEEFNPQLNVTEDLLRQKFKRDEKLRQTLRSNQAQKRIEAENEGDMSSEEEVIIDAE